MTPNRCKLLVLAAVGVSVCKLALASGPAVTGLVAPADSAVTAADNPTGLTRLQHPEWVGQVTAFSANSTDDITAGPASRSVDSTTNLAIPAVYCAKPWNDRLALGISLTVPAGIGSDPGDATIGRYLLEKWSLAYVSLAPAAAYRLNDELSLGATGG